MDSQSGSTPDYNETLRKVCVSIHTLVVFLLTGITDLQQPSECPRDFRAGVETVPHNPRAFSGLSEGYREQQKESRLYSGGRRGHVECRNGIPGDRQVNVIECIFDTHTSHLKYITGKDKGRLIIYIHLPTSYSDYRVE